MAGANFSTEADTGSRSPDVLCAFLLALLSFAIGYLLALRWYELEVFSQFNVIFDTDPVTWLRYYASGNPDVGTTKHPLGAYYFGIPVLGLSLAIDAIVPAGDAEALRVSLALMAAPAATALKTVLIYATCRQLGLHWQTATFVTLISALSFSSIIFSAIPETYVSSGLFISASLFFLTRRVFGAGAMFGLCAACFLAVGASTANTLFVFVVFCGALWRRRATFSTIVTAGLVTVAVFIAALSTHWTLSEIRGWPLDFKTVFLPDKNDVATHKPNLSLQLENAARFPERLARTIIATPPLKKENLLFFDGDVHQYELSHNPIEWQNKAAIALWLIGTLAVVASLVRASRGPVLAQVTAAVALGTLGAYVALFSFYGYNTFLYSQHWQGPTVVLIAAALAARPPRGRATTYLLSAVVCVLVVANITVLSGIDAMLVQSCGEICS